MVKLGTTDLEVFGRCLGGNVFGWTADEPGSVAVLDAYAEAGGNFIDTADSYTRSVEGNSGGESETIIGRWMAVRGNRDRMVIATKVSGLPPHTGLSERAIRGGVEDSLRRLGTDHIDLYYAHHDDPDTPVEETVAAFDGLVRAGKVRYVAASNFSPERLAASLAFADREGMARYVALQTHYNLMERERFEGPLADLAARETMAVLPYYALASGFLTGKYRPGVTVDSPRARRVAGTYVGTERGAKVLAALDGVATAHDTSMAAVALAWLAAQPTVTAPIASARTTGQLTAILESARLSLTPGELAVLTTASA